MPSVVVFGDRRLAGRTLRALRGLGLDPIDAAGAATARTLPSIDGPAWWLRAGAWPVSPPSFPLPSATGLPLAALGAVVAPDDDDAHEGAFRWDEILAQTGGDLRRAAGAIPIVSAYCEAPLVREIGRRVTAGEPIQGAIEATLDPRRARIVRYAPLDAFDDARLRVMLAVTSLQQGGAERVVLDLHEELPAAGVRSIVAVTGRPTRASLPEPHELVDVSRSSPKRAARIDTLGEIALENTVDLVHAHLLSGDDLARLATRGIPIAVTVHNTREGWPEGLGTLAREQASLLVACSLAAEADLRAGAVPVPARTVWNGIDVERLRPSRALRAAGTAFRRAHGLGADDLVLLAVANPRPQKRLHLLPAVLAEARKLLARHGSPRAPKLVIAGDADPRTEPARSSAMALREAITALGLEPHVLLVGSIDDPAPALAASDVLVSVSAHEGLSLAHLEALAAGLPVVATDAGGTREIAPDHPSIEVLARDATPAEVAEAAVRLATRRPAGGAGAIAEVFSRRRMATRYAALYPRAIAASRRARGEGLLLVTNNLSTGGAQSSARRLLTLLASEGTRTRAAVLEEQPAFPTPGRRALEAAGVPVLALPPPDRIDAAEATRRLLDWIDDDPPEAVLFWNALAEHKILLADALLDVPIFDVSPGEMYFASLDRFFARRRPGLPYRDARAYGARLAGVIVKYAAESARAAEVLGAPVHVVPNGVVLGERRERREPSEHRVVLGTAARLAPQKKLEALLEALRLAAPRLPPHVLRIAGGPERGSEAYAAALRDQADGLSVEWVGEVGDTAAFLAELDVFAMISEPAGCPNASLEAMAAGLPVIATDVGGAAEQVVDGRTGRLVPPNDAAALAAAIIEIACDSGLARRFGDAGRARAEERFDVRRMAADYRRVCLP